MKKHARYRIPLLSLVFALLCVGAYAQQNSEITGTVVDKESAAVAGAHLVLTKEVEYQFHEENPAPPDAEFTLSAFGLPEPFYAKSANRPYLWFVAAGVGCFAISVMLYRLRQVRNRAA